MAVDERARHKAHTKLEQALGPEEAATVMELLPPVGWADVARKNDLDHLHTLIKSDLGQLRTEFTGALDQHRAETTSALAEVRIQGHKDTVRLMWLVTTGLLANALAVVTFALQSASGT